MNEIMAVKKKIENMIYEIRGVQVMLDSGLALLYQVETKRINEAVSRNREKFPDRYTWVLDDDEYINLRSQSATANNKSIAMKRYNPRVFTEQGVAMLATILKSDIATKVSIAIMDTFVAMRHFILENKDLYVSINNMNNKIDYLNKKVIEYDDKFEELFSMFGNEYLLEKLYFEGQIYDAYSKLIEIMKSAKKELIVIDNYADKTLLDIISNLNVNVTIITKEKGLLKELDIKKYNEEYHNLRVIYNNSFHDRFIFIDNKILYHCGASFKDLGHKCFAIQRLESEDIINNLKSKISLLVKDSLKC